MDREDVRKGFAICGIAYLLILWLIGIAAGSYLIHANNTDRWLEGYTRTLIADTSSVSTALRSWNIHPVIDVKLV